MKTPAEMYSASPTPYRGLPELTYPLHDRDVVVTACGRICMHRKRINISHVLVSGPQGIDVSGAPGSELDAFVRKEIASWAKVIEDNNIKSGD